jgi:hypothetical protein
MSQRAGAADWRGTQPRHDDAVRAYPDGVVAWLAESAGQPT